MFKIDWKSWNKLTFLICIDIFDLLIDNFDLLIDSFDLLINSFDLLIDSFNFLIDLYWPFNWKEIANARLSQNRLKLDRNRDCLYNINIWFWIGFFRPNLLESEFESSTIQFGTPNCPSLTSTSYWCKISFMNNHITRLLNEN